MIMEIEVYRSFKDLQSNKKAFAAKIDCPDLFSFDKAVSVFNSIFSSECVVLVTGV